MQDLTVIFMYKSRKPTLYTSILQYFIQLNNRGRPPTIVSSKETFYKHKNINTPIFAQLTNPEWKPPDNCSLFLNKMREDVQREVGQLTSLAPPSFDPGAEQFASMVPSAATGYGLGLGVSLDICCYFLAIETF